MSFAVFLKPIADEFGWTRQSVSSVFGVSALVAALFAPAAGALIDRVGARRVVIPCLSVAALVFAARAFVTPPFWHLVALFATTGVVGLGCAPMAYVRLVSSWFDERRGQALGFAVAGAALGGMVHPALAHVLINRVGWRTAQLVLGALMLGLGVPAVAAFLRTRPVAPATTRPAGAPAAVRGAMATRAFWIVALGTLCDSIVNSSVTVHLPALVTDRGFGAGTGAVALSTLGAATFLGRLSSGWLLDRFVAPYVAAGLLAISTAGVLLFVGAESAAAHFVAAALVGFGMGGDADVTPYLLTRYFGLSAFSTLYGWTFTATALAWAIGPTLMGRAFDVSGSYGPHLTRLAVMLAVASAAMCLLPRRAAPAPDLAYGRL